MKIFCGIVFILIQSLIIEHSFCLTNSSTWQCEGSSCNNSLLNSTNKRQVSQMVNQQTTVVQGPVSVPASVPLAGGALTRCSGGSCAQVHATQGSAAVTVAGMGGVALDCLGESCFSAVLNQGKRAVSQSVSQQTTIVQDPVPVPVPSPGGSLTRCSGGSCAQVHATQGDVAVAVAKQGKTGIDCLSGSCAGAVVNQRKRGSGISQSVSQQTTVVQGPVATPVSVLLAGGALTRCSGSSCSQIHATQGSAAITVAGAGGVGLDCLDGSCTGGVLNQRKRAVSQSVSQQTTVVQYPEPEPAPTPVPVLGGSLTRCSGSSCSQIQATQGDAAIAAASQGKTGLDCTSGSCAGGIIKQKRDESLNKTIKARMIGSLTSCDGSGTCSGSTFNQKQSAIQIASMGGSGTSCTSGACGGAIVNQRKRAMSQTVSQQTTIVRDPVPVPVPSPGGALTRCSGGSCAQVHATQGDVAVAVAKQGKTGIDCLSGSCVGAVLNQRKRQVSQTVNQQTTVVQGPVSVPASVPLAGGALTRCSGGSCAQVHATQGSAAIAAAGMGGVGLDCLGGSCTGAVLKQGKRAVSQSVSQQTTVVQGSVPVSLPGGSLTRCSGSSCSQIHATQGDAAINVAGMGGVGLDCLDGSCTGANLNQDKHASRILQPVRQQTAFVQDPTPEPVPFPGGALTRCSGSSCSQINATQGNAAVTIAGMGGVGLDCSDGSCAGGILIQKKRELLLKKLNDNNTRNTDEEKKMDHVFKCEDNSCNNGQFVQGLAPNVTLIDTDLLQCKSGSCKNSSVEQTR